MLPAGAISLQSEQFALDLDNATLTRNIHQLEKLLSEIEKQLPNEDVASQSRMYYLIGTVYSDFAKAKGIPMEDSLKRQLYCF